MKQNQEYSIPWFPGLLLGIGAFLASYFLVQDYLSYGYTLNAAVELEEWQKQTWYLFSAHRVPIVESASSNGESMLMGPKVNLIEQAEPRFQFLYLIPPMPLFAAGLIMADHMGGRYKASYSFLNGATIALGYGLASLFLAWYSAETVSALGVTARLGPSFVDTFVFAVLGFPIVFGGFGGLAHYASKQL